MKPEKIYLLPGRGRALDEGLGAELLRRGFNVEGRALVDDFGKLFYPQQIDIIQADLVRINSPEAKLIAISFGAYLYLQAQIGLPAFRGKVLLLSPIVGKATHSQLGKIFIPPQSDRIKNCVKEGQFPLPKRFEIHLGSQDWQCPNDQMKEIASYLDIPLHIVEGAGHRLENEYVKKILEKWL
ncbi:hypothetical protein [Thorsellia kenyensis]|uniref:Alpha/beta hydrolase n=1 Tax=Thorsellia kenyensis TaxID=1549888 RepID=A0ABV6CEE9_9GAMM